MDLCEGSLMSLNVQFANDSRRGVIQVSRDENNSFPATSSNLQSHVVASTFAVPGLWAYAANNAIVVVKPAVPPRSWPQFTMLDGSGWDKYTSVSFCQDPPQKWPIERSPLVTASNRGLVRIFNIDDNATVKFHTCHAEHRAIAEWSPRNSKLVYAADDIGQLSIWDVVENSSIILAFDNLKTSCMAVSPYEDNIVALGDKDGSARILDTSGTGVILHRILHEGEIFSVSWKPVGTWSTMMKLPEYVEPFLAVSSASFKPITVGVWDREGKEITILGLSECEGVPRRVLMRHIPSTWVRMPSDGTNDPKLGLVTCGPTGEILCWKENDSIPDIIHELHKDCVIFALMQSGDVLWSISSEPYMIGWNLCLGKVETVIPTFSGICSISVSPVENSHLAIGGVDSYIRIVKVAPGFPNDEIPEIPLLPYRLQGKVTAVAWHPYLDKLGFGTDNGILGIYDCKSNSRQAMEFSRKIAGTIYTVDWGPKCYTAEFEAKSPPKVDAAGDGLKDLRRGSLWLFACGNRSVFGVHPGRRENALVNIGRIIGITNGGSTEGRAYAGISDIKWSADHVYLAVGYSDGKIEIYAAPYLKLRCWIKCHGSSIQFLSWRTLDFIDECVHKFFASSANDGMAKIYDLARLYTSEILNNPDTPALEFINSMSILNGHRGLRVIQVVWSPHDDNHIITVSYDRTAVLWDLRKMCRIARYMGHEHRLVAVAFHPTNPYKIFTYSDEMVTNPSFHIWDYRQHPDDENYQELMASESMTGSKVEAVKALAAPMPKLMFRPGKEDSAVGKDKKENHAFTHVILKDMAMDELAEGVKLCEIAEDYTIVGEVKTWETVSELARTVENIEENAQVIAKDDD